MEIAGSSGPESVELAAACGLILDEWQAEFLYDGMAERADGSWAASDVGLIASRQNGKNGAVEARELFGAVILGEHIIHTSHLFKTTRESFGRLRDLIEGNPEVHDCLTGSVASAQSGFEMRFRSGGRVTFIARSRTSGRGLTGDLLIFDEAQELDDDGQGALLPTISARPLAQTWYLGSAPNLGSTVFHRIRKRGRSGTETRLAFREHSADPDSDPSDREAWAQANPALGIRISEETIESERLAMSEEMFLAERLSISPDIDYGNSVIPADVWQAVCSPDVVPDGRVVFAVDCNPERTAAAVAVSDAEGRAELIESERGTGWLVSRTIELARKWNASVAVDPNGPAGSFIPELRAAGVTIIEVGGAALVKACGLFFDACVDQHIRVRADSRLDRALGGAKQKPSGDAWVWTRKNSDSDITPVVAVTVGYWAAQQNVDPVANVH